MNNCSSLTTTHWKLGKRKVSIRTPLRIIVYVKQAPFYMLLQHRQHLELLMV